MLISLKIGLRHWTKRIDDGRKETCKHSNNKPWKILKEMGIQTTWPTSWETYMQVRKQQLELDMEQQTGSK